MTLMQVGTSRASVQHSAIAAGLSACLAMASTFAQPVDINAQELVKQTADRVLDAIRDDRAAFERRPKAVYELVEEVVFPHVDFENMARWALGKYWRRADEEQREQFVREFRTLILRTYATALMEYRDQEIVYLPMRGEELGTDVTVRTEIRQQGGPPVPVNYRLHRVADTWKVYDLSIDGISLLTTYRSSFSTQIRQQGLHAFLNKLAERNAASQVQSPRRAGGGEK